MVFLGKEIKREGKKGEREKSSCMYKIGIILVVFSVENVKQDTCNFKFFVLILKN